jgi:hypothetical protein
VLGWAAATGTPQTCRFCLWDGFGFLHPGAISVLTLGEPSTAAPYPPGREVAGQPRLRLPDRDYLVFRGPVTAVRVVGVGLGPYALGCREGPNLWWPDDRAWVVGSDIDLHSTYVGGSRKLADGLLDCEDLEVITCQLDDPIAFASDTVNAPAT